ncbi:MAG: hypothetical protein UFG06_01255 [Lachnospiraceae bacterium]|nr:hypothetical protein [Lachnospiraceae bacterium]
MEVDILIDSFTNCLIERKTGEEIATEYRLREIPIQPADYKGWKFNWSSTEKNGYHIYELFLKGDNIVQGRISLKVDGGVADVDIIEAAPHNYSHFGTYEGVGAHLFAIACQISFEAGCDGVVAFTSKSDLVRYYMNKLNAVEITPRRMVIFENAAQILLNKYIRK